MKKYFLIAFLLSAVLFFLRFYGCSSQKIVAEIGDRIITLEEFEEKYLIKNAYNKETARNKPVQDKIDYLNSLISTELKAKIGEEKKLDTIQSFINDLKIGERKLLSDVYLHNKVVEPNLEDYYNKIRFDIRVSHILLTLEKNYGIEDSIKTYFLASEIIKRLSANESFDSLAKIYSADLETRERGGDLYYFSPNMTVFDFEYAAYNLNPGEFTKEPVRTPLGLHIIKMTDKVERYDSARVSHILITDPVNETGIKDSISSYNKIMEIYQKLKDGGDFEELAKEFSNDTINKARGGDLGYIKRRQYAFPFDSTVFSLKPGQFSGVIRTNYGWHIIKMTDAVKVKPFNEMKNMLAVLYPRSIYFRKEYAHLITDLRTKYNLNVEESGLKFLADKIKDSTLAFVVINPNKLFSEEDKKVVTAKYNGGEITVNDLIIYVSTNSAAANKELTYINLINLILSSADEILLSKESLSEGLNNSKKYIESYNEYRKYLLSDLVDKNIITPEIVISEPEIMEYFNTNRKQMKINIDGILREKTIDEARDEIITALKNEKFKGTENMFIENLKIKYNVTVNYDLLENLYKD
jgi:peptidyl-prolyl cis-trans isomerase SurA